MKIHDFDAKFFDYARTWMAMHPGMTEKQVEDSYNEIMLNWLNAPAKWLDGEKPGEYFAKYEDAGALVGWLLDYFAQRVPAPDMLLNRIAELGPEAEAKFEAQMAQMADWYREWQDAFDGDRSANEDARFVLPNACATRLTMTMNARELIHFFSLRCCNRAQWEIRTLAEQMYRLVLPIAPAIFENAGPGCVRGACPEGSRSCGKAAEVKAHYAQLAEEVVQQPE
jgi:hypothetical protein